MTAMVIAVTATATACSHPLKDHGPLPPRYSGPPVPADTVVSELTSAMAAEGVTLKRTPQELIALDCQESLTGEHASATADAVLEGGFARARSGHGWQPGPDLGSGSLALRKGNWTATALLPGSLAAGSPTTQFVITLLCDGARSKSSTRKASPPV
ncbi:hypothetical protein [Streptomyces sp. NPDC051211]|uniref:hypothetical protein n=1 Tax=Streptomyces sp. NPDC051211 TaxID=3154643 RepID=UPI00344FD7FB